MSMLMDPQQKPQPSAEQPPTPHYFVAPRRSWTERINMRVVVFALVVAVVIGVPFYKWLQMALNGGIVNHGTYYTLDLKAMSNFDFDQINGEIEDIPQKWRELEGKHVEMIGQMWAPNEAADGKLKYFQLCFNRSKCCFQGPPLVQHFVDCNVKPNTAAYYDDDFVRVDGILHIQVKKGQNKQGVNGVISIYSVEVDGVEPM